MKKGIDIITPTFQEEFISSVKENDIFSVGQEVMEIIQRVLSYVTPFHK
ncbi:MAG: hypothetical protein ACJ0QK_02560 [Flavobacteriales bacterium]